MIELLVIVAAYLIGAVPFGYAIARWHGIDIFQAGSGNIGATNVGRIVGRKWGILCFFLDFAKGAGPALAGRLLAAPDSALGPDGLPVLAGLAAFVGHLFPVYLGFRGGKGVATGAGVISVLLPGPFGLALLAWVVVVGASAYVSLASLAAAAALCLARIFLTPAPFASENRTLTAFCFITAALVFVRHRTNIRRLYQGDEGKTRWVPVMTLSKTLHVLAVGLWFGSLIFFTFIVALTTFHTFETMGADPQAIEREWLPLTADFDKAQGTRLAGAVVGPIFPKLFLLEGICGFIVVCTALAWTKRFPERVHRVRWLLAVVALCTVLGAWPIAVKVSELRALRYSDVAAIAEPAQQAFGMWHGISLLLNFVTCILVTIVMGLAARLPVEPNDEPAESAEKA